MSFHPIFVNLAVFVLAAGIALELLYLITQKTQFRKFGGYLLWSGTALAICAVLSGLRAFSTVDIPKEALDTVKTHRFSGLLTLALLAAAVVLRFAAERFSDLGKVLHWLYYALLIAIAAMLFRTAAIGGDMAYKYQLRGPEPATQPIEKPGFED